MPDFEAFVEGSADLVTVLESNGTVRYQNAAVERVCGYARADVVGENFFEYVHSDDRARLRTLVRDPDSGSLEDPVRYRFRGADGDWIRLETTDGPLRQPEGYGIRSREIGDRDDLERSLERYAVILDALEDGVYAIDEDGTIVYVNEEYAAMKGVDRDDLVGTDIYEWGSADAIDRIRAAREELAADDRDVGVAEFEFSTADGDGIPVEMRFSSVSQPGDEIERVGVVRDVSARKARESALQRKNERLEEFASIVSHDLRNPLNVARGNLDLAREERDGDRLEAVAAAHERMDALIEDLLTLAREGAVVTDAVDVDLATAVERSWRTVDTGEATLVVDTDRTITADRSRLRRLFENLIRNAVEHGSTSPDSQARQDAVEHGSTSPASQTQQDAVEHGGSAVAVTVGDLEDGFYVEDDGSGIPADQRDRVLESGYSTATEGTGFGLAIVSRIVDAHGWSIAVAESADGGARFEITGVESADESSH